MSELTALLQLADAAFPAGAFAHSFGLETAIAEGTVHDAATLDAWLRAYLDGSFATLDGAAFVLAARDGIPAELLDDRLDAAQSNSELRRANAHLARATLATFDAMGVTSERIAAYAAAIGSGTCAGSHAIAVALGYAASSIAWRTALVAHASSTIATLASCAARAVPLGQRAVARVRWEIRPAIERAAAGAANVASIDDLATGATSIEIDGLRHRLLDGRLFAS